MASHKFSELGDGVKTRFVIPAVYTSVDDVEVRNASNVVIATPPYTVTPDNYIQFSTALPLNFRVTVTITVPDVESPGGGGVTEGQLEAALDAATAEILAGTADPLPIGTIIKVRGNLPAPTGYEFVDDLAYNSYEQGRGATDVRFTITSASAEPVNGRSPEGFSIGRANHGYLKYEYVGGTIASNSIQYVPTGADGVAYSGPPTWPTALETEGAKQIVAFDQVADNSGLWTVVGIITSDTTTYAIAWTFDTGTDTWTELGTSTATGTFEAQSLTQCLVHFVDGANISVGCHIPASVNWLVVNAADGTNEILASASFADNPGFAAEIGLSSRENGYTLFGSTIDNVIRARKMSIIVDGDRKVASAYKSTVMSVAGVTTSSLALVHQNTLDAGFSLLAPFAAYFISIPDTVDPASVEQITGRHPLIGDNFIMPIGCAFISPLNDIFSLVYYEKISDGFFKFQQLDLEVQPLIDTFFRYAQKTTTD